MRQRLPCRAVGDALEEREESVVCFAAADALVQKFVTGAVEKRQGDVFHPRFSDVKVVQFLNSPSRVADGIERARSDEQRHILIQPRDILFRVQPPQSAEKVGVEAV